MLIESKDVKQSEDGLRRRWFSDDFFDLIIWQDKNNYIVKFELCYNKFRDEHAFVWDKGEGFSHLKVDDGEQRPDHFKMSPVLVTDGHFDRNAVLEKFRIASKKIDPKLVDLICGRLQAGQ